MTEHLKITAKIPRKRYVADGSQTVFSFDFVLFQPSELLVTVDGVPVTSGVGVSLQADGTGTATFAAAPAADAVVVLQRRVTIKRETDFQEGGELRAKTLNDEFDFQTAALQQVETAAARALQLPIDDADNAVTVLPIAGVRATKMLAFDASGNPTLSNQSLAQIEDGTNAAAASAANAASSAAAAAVFVATAQNAASDAGTQATNAAASAAAAAASASLIALPLTLASGGTGATTAPAARTNLGLGTAASLNVGTAANQVPQLDGLGRLPALDGSQLTNLAGSMTQVTAGEALAIRDLIYQDLFNQRGGGADRWYRVDTDATAPVRIGPRIGIALAAISSGAVGSAQVRPGRVSGYSGLAAGQPVFASATVGAITQTAPAIPATGTQNATRLIGYAVSAAEIDFNPEDDTVFTARNSAVAVDGTITVHHWSDSGAREREQAAYLVQAAVPSLISGGTGTNRGSPPAAWFDGVLTGADQGTFATWYGKDYGTPRSLVQARIVGATTRGTNTNGGTGGLTWRGSNNGTDWTAIDTVTGLSGVGSANWIATLTIGTPQSWRFTEVQVTNSASDSTLFLAEIQFFEASAARDEPLTIGGSVANATATDRVNVRYDDGSGGNADTRTTFVNRTGATRDLACEVML
jgi:hypothetical protein